MNARAGWFDVDRAGLARVASRRTKVFILRELIQNAWDEQSTMVTVEVHPPTKGSGFSTIIVTDDSPEGFADLAHAYTLFAPSKKVTDAQKRGRFNFGEKLVLALCVEARIETTKGTILFDRGEQRRRSPKKLDAGSKFVGLLKLNSDERDQLLAAARSMIPPAGKRTYVNGIEVFPRTAIATAHSYLDTEKAGDDGILRKAHEFCDIHVYEVLPGEKAHLYEMGIPVVETGDRWHVDVGQKVPLNMERDNVAPSYLAQVRAYVANVTHDLLTVEDANAPWARDALGSIWTEKETVKKLVALRFGEQVVVHDPNDQEANQKAAAQGYTVVTSSQLSAEEWSRVRNAGAMPTAGSLFPTPKAYGENGRQLDWIDPTPAMQRFVAIAEEIGLHLLDRTFNIRFCDSSWWKFEGTINVETDQLIVNVGLLGRGEFAEGAISERLLEFLIHEFAHDVEGNHLSDRYHDTLCKFGAKVARLAIDRPEVFR